MEKKVGDIDPGQVLENEYRIAVLEEIVQLLVAKVGSKALSQKEVREIRKKVVARLQEKYPNSGITLKE